MSNIFLKEEDFETTINTLIAHNTQNEFYHHPHVRAQSLAAREQQAHNGITAAPSSAQKRKWSGAEHEKLLKYVCAKCGMEFGRESHYEQHLDDVHKELQMAKGLKMVIRSGNQAECRICGAHVQHRTVRDLQSHHLQHLQHKQYKCKCHGYYFHERTEVIEHLAYRSKREVEREAERKAERLANVKSMAVSNVGYSLPVGDDSYYDPQYPETGIGYICSECGIDFSGEDVWKQHCNESHYFKTLEGLNMVRLESGSVRCNECSVIIAGKWDNYKLRRHKFTHSPFKAFYCRVCKHSRKRKDDVLQHIRQTHALRGKKYYKTEFE